MSLDNLVCALLETALNKLHQLDNSAAQKRKALDGVVIGATIKELNKPLYFVISNQQVDILAHYEATSDCFISLNLSALIALQDNHQLTNLVKSGQLEVQGDIKIVQQFAQLLTEMDIDWEEHLASTMGDLLAHKIVYLAKNSAHKLRQQGEKSQQQLAQIITEELKIAPGPLEVAHFCDQVSTLAQQLTRLEKKIMQY